MNAIKRQNKKIFDPTAKQLVVLEIAILLLKEGSIPLPNNIIKYLEKTKIKTGIKCVHHSTIWSWFNKSDFKEWFTQKISKKILEDDPHFESKKLVYVDRMWKLAMSGTEPHNMRAAEIFAKLTGLYNDNINISVDNSQKTINVQTTVPRIEDITTEGLKIYKQETLNLENAAGEAKQED